MYHPRLYGHHYEMGLQYGKLLNRNGFVLPEMDEKRKIFGVQSYTELNQFYPEIIEEITGFADGIGVQPEILGAFILSIGIFENVAQCSVFTFRNANGALIARNYDMLFAFKKFTQSSLIAPLGKYAFICQSDVFIGCVDGMNEKGLSIAMTFVNGTKVQPGIGFYFVVRKVLEDCATIEEGVELIAEAKVSRASNFILADRNGNGAVVESSPERNQVRSMKKDQRFQVITNHFVSEKMKPFDRGGVEWSMSYSRYNEMVKQLESFKELNLDQAKEILSNPCVCLNLRKEKFGTIWSTVADLSWLSLERAETLPRVKNYKKDDRLNWWLSKRQRMNKK